MKRIKLLKAALEFKEGKKAAAQRLVSEIKAERKTLIPSFRNKIMKRYTG